MVNSVGKRLQQARFNKQISVEEAARVTRIRPDKLHDLEDDNYANFPSLAYAKGFLLIYARFLEVDVSDFADSLQAPNPVSSDDYEYLNAAAVGPQPQPSRREYHFSARREHTILPVVVFGILACGIGVVIYFIVQFQRFSGTNLDDISDKKETPPAATASASASPAISAIAQSPAPVAVATSPAPIFAPRASAPDLSNTPPGAPIASQPNQPASTGLNAPAYDPAREVRRAEAVGSTPQASPANPPLPPVGAAPAPVLSAIAPTAPADLAAVTPMPVAPTPPPVVATPEPIKQLSIQPIRKTMVTIRKDVADSAPVFEDWLYPGVGPLKLKGRKFWIQVQDPSAVQITRDGQPLPTGQGDIQIE